MLKLLSNDRLPAVRTHDQIQSLTDFLDMSDKSDAFAAPPLARKSQCIRTSKISYAKNLRRPILRTSFYDCRSGKALIEAHRRHFDYLTASNRRFTRRSADSRSHHHSNARLSCFDVCSQASGCSVLYFSLK